MNTIATKRRDPMWVALVSVIGIFMLLSCGGGGGGGGDNSNSTQQPQGARSAEQEITPDGGTISIVDEYNNTIQVTFPKDALSETALLSLSLLSEQPSLPIEERHASAFEIKPYDTELYMPVSITISYDSSIQDIDIATLFRKKSDTLIIPLSNHTYTGDWEISAETFILGVFAEGKQSVDQTVDLLKLLFASPPMSSANQNYRTAMDSTCYTDISKAIWDAWRETAFAGDELFQNYEWMMLNITGEYDDVDFIVEWKEICEKIAGKGAQLVLDRCTPTNICDRNYVYTIMSAQETIQDMNCIGEMDSTETSEVFMELGFRYDDIIAECTDYGYLDIQLSAITNEVAYGPWTPYYGETRYDLQGNIPVYVEVSNVAGWENITTQRSRVLNIIDTTGFITFWPDLPEASYTCIPNDFGYINVDVTGTKDYSGVYSLCITTYHYTGRTVECPVSYSSHNTSNDLQLTGIRNFLIELSENNPTDGARAKDSPYEAPYGWSVIAELKLMP